ncbi:MAG TPA: hypothetical protein VM099_10845 [Gemmatimonadaceae bacterium]|nr:hypothetical protein [Gemmatimonadaceae bacterium]
MRNPTRSIFIVVAAALLQSCTSPFDGTICTDQFVYGLNVTVLDSITLSPPAKATLLARSGAFADSVGPRAPFPLSNGGPPMLILSTAGERAGVYDITVKAPGYRDWTKNAVTVTADVCHVNPVPVTAKLQQ